MNVLLWVLQWILALLLVGSFLATPGLIRRGMARNPINARLMSFVGLACAVALLVPWYTGHLRPLTPIAAVVVSLTAIFDSLTNRMPPSDRLYNAVVILMAGMVAVSRFSEL